MKAVESRIQRAEAAINELAEDSCVAPAFVEVIAENKFEYNGKTYTSLAALKKALDKFCGRVWPIRALMDEPDRSVINKALDAVLTKEWYAEKSRQQDIKVKKLGSRATDKDWFAQAVEKAWTERENSNHEK